MLFGHQNDANQSNAPATAPSVDTPQNPTSVGVNPLAVDPTTGVSLPTTTTDAVASVDPSQEEPSILDQPVVSDTNIQSAFAGDPAPTTPFGSDQASAPSLDSVAQPTPDPISATSAVPPADPMPTLGNAAIPAPQHDPIPQQLPQADYSTTSTPSYSGDDLLNIKQQALSQLGPLVGQLEQSPEEKFRTTMMLIQSTDNSALLKDAYDAAQSISDEKVRAQALLDIVNEINYFTQQSSSDMPSPTTV